MFDNILVVCVGNICRSPTAQYLLASLLPHKTIASAGIGALVGKTADNMASTIAIENGIDLSGHIAQQLTSELCRAFDLILVMEQGHINAVTNIAPEVRGKTMLLSQWLNKEDIPDPYRQSKEAFEHAFLLIDKASHTWAKKLS